MDNISVLISVLSTRGIGLGIANKLIPSQNISSEIELIDFLMQKASKIPRLKLTIDQIKSGIEKANRIISKSIDLNISILPFNSFLYPLSITQIRNPPLVLSYRGDISLLKERRIALIGTREPSLLGKEVALHYGKSLAEAGFTITSGLALGIDSLAHQGCLEAKGKTIAIIGNGLDTVYPSENNRLTERILNGGGLIISVSLVGDKANIGSLLRRNSVLAGLCKKVIVVETKLKGGTIRTVDLSLKYGNRVGCLTYKNETRLGNIQLLNNPYVAALFNDNDVNHFVED